MKNSFNLVDQKWIPCLYMDGSSCEYSLLELFSNAHAIRRLNSDLSVEKIALYRFFLAILHRNFGPNSTYEWQRLWQLGQFDGGTLSSYFSKWYSHFDLFDDTHPFYQTPNIDTEIRPLLGYSFYLALYHLASGNNATLFDHHTQESDFVINYSQAARLLVTAQSFAFGFQTLKDGPSARGINFILLGDNLFHTLLLNMIRYDQSSPFQILDIDLPAWEQDDPFSHQRTKPDGYLDYLTWQSRKILLHPEKDKIRLIQVDNGLKLAVTEEPYTKNPMMAYSIVEKPAKNQSPYRLLKFQEGRVLWRDSTAIMETTSNKQFPPLAINWVQDCNIHLENVHLNSIGISSDQGKVNYYMEELFSFPAIYLEKEILVAHLKTCLQNAEIVRQKLWGAVNKIAEILISPESDLDDEKQSDKKGKQNLVDHLYAEDQYWSWLEPSFYQLLYDLPNNELGAVEIWNQQLQNSVWKAFEFAREYIGSSPVALKAGVQAAQILRAGLKKEFEK